MRLSGKTADSILAIGLLLLIAGGITFYTNPTTTQSTERFTPGNLTERTLAVQDAQKSGSKTYDFETNFTPGIGRIEDVPSQQKSWQNQAAKECEKNFTAKQRCQVLE